MKRLPRALGLLFLLWACTASQPQQEIAAAFRTFLADVKAGKQEGILAAAPFLARLPAPQKEAAVQTFRRFADADPGKLVLQVTAGARGSYDLHVSVQGAEWAMVVPFQRSARGAWEISPVLQGVQHIDVVPAQ